MAPEQSFDTLAQCARYRERQADELIKRMEAVPEGSPAFKIYAPAGHALHVGYVSLKSGLMKVKDIIEWSVRWSTPSWTLDEDAPVADGVLVDLSLGGTTIIGLAVQCPDGKYFGSIRAPGPVYDHVLEFLKQNYGRTLREVMDADIDISDVIQ
jgi:hypothetical protein